MRDDEAMTVSVLNREMYSEAEAARLLGVPQGTLHYWLEGGSRRKKTYKPIIRLEPLGKRTVTWSEFIEAGLLRQYRREHHVPMAELRAFIDLLRERTGSPYPLVHCKPFIYDRKLVMEAQDEAQLDADFCLVAVVRGQLILTPAARDFVERVVWEDDVAAGWRPHDDPRSPVRIAPDLRFGSPSVAGISTEAVWEQAEAGADDAEIAEMFGVTLDDVRWSLAYETSARAA
jgi:uncharacterized protein (DUF433 family)/DNA-binding transcriptional MerR regulator